MKKRSRCEFEQSCEHLLRLSVWPDVLLFLSQRECARLLCCQLELRRRLLFLVTAKFVWPAEYCFSSGSVQPRMAQGIKNMMWNCLGSCIVHSSSNNSVRMEFNRFDASLSPGVLPPNLQ